MKFRDCMFNFRKIRVGDLIIIIIALVCAIIIFLMTLPKDFESEKRMLVIRTDQEIEEIPFDETDDRTISFTFLAGSGKVQIKNQQVRMLRMSEELCPNQICSKVSWIEYSNQSIVCLPNKIVVTIEDDKDKVFDGLSY